MLVPALTFVGMLIVGTLLGLGALLFAQTVLALWARRRSEPALDPTADPRIAILIPAHNEAAGISKTLASLMAQTGPRDRVVVIADNCSDDTAAVAARCGAVVHARTDTVLRGKGYALDYGLQQLRSDPPDVVLMFDADCTVGPGTIRILAVRAQQLRRPVQARYIIRANDRKVSSLLAEFAQRLRNWVRPLGMKAAGLPTQLNGSGMGFRWSLFERQSVASGHITEDLHLGLDFARQKLYPHFCPDAVVDSDAVVNAAGLRMQRTRWEHGNLGTILSEWPKVAGQAVRRMDIRLAFMAWDLAVPPLALYAMVLLATFAAGLAVGLLGGPWWPAATLGAVVALLLLTIVMAQRGFARDLMSLTEIFLAVPLYLAGKAPIYFRFLFNRQVEWVRTKRDES